MAVEETDGGGSGRNAGVQALGAEIGFSNSLHPSFLIGKWVYNSYRGEL